MSANVHRCFHCGQDCCVDYGGAPIEPLYCMSCYDENLADPDSDEEDEELLDEPGGGGR